MYVHCGARACLWTAVGQQVRVLCDDGGHIMGAGQKRQLRVSFIGRHYKLYPLPLQHLYPPVKSESAQLQVKRDSYDSTVTCVFECTQTDLRCITASACYHSMSLPR